ncbi:unnamed protein product [Rangifer tarandus platyrhynchus]|uniref:Uncharacterized protein n=1 Tax=Rangifer tarandus platyrhynchus TaxID=3082113 RepID=A0ABN8ZAJ3_RANTA|nr:unnamed protein product [Rangifer tarandus platyrhynchus]
MAPGCPAVFTEGARESLAEVETKHVRGGGQRVRKESPFRITRAGFEALYVLRGDSVQVALVLRVRSSEKPRLETRICDLVSQMVTAGVLPVDEMVRGQDLKDNYQLDLLCALDQTAPCPPLCQQDACVTRLAGTDADVPSQHREEAIEGREMLSNLDKVSYVQCSFKTCVCWAGAKAEIRSRWYISAVRQVRLGSCLEDGPSLESGCGEKVTMKRARVVGGVAGSTCSQSQKLTGARAVTGRMEGTDVGGRPVASTQELPASVSASFSSKLQGKQARYLEVLMEHQSGLWGAGLCQADLRADFVIPEQISERQGQCGLCPSHAASDPPLPGFRAPGVSSGKPNLRSLQCPLGPTPCGP